MAHISVSSQNLIQDYTLAQTSQHIRDMSAKEVPQDSEDGSKSSEGSDGDSEDNLASVGTAKDVDGDTNMGMENDCDEDLGYSSKESTGAFIVVGDDLDKPLEFPLSPIPSSCGTSPKPSQIDSTIVLQGDAISCESIGKLFYPLFC
ncbi:hypothetical protein BT96DRAFT_921422 [Gymnopus androsaceus JB14]|uniref:Uncharacterized protein n=1 Tax=Gymnopus androsaceus JB14 TaxID=1447944 RepID=A0A6A4HJG2_9AGAR|nr:hypothetical protein BT96DRAFT_921422 [Gymnopus androsaceus JB14]